MFDRVAAALVPGGRFAWNVFAFSASLATALDGQRVERAGGRWEIATNVPADSRIDITRGRGLERIGTFSLWWATRREWEGLIDVAGLELEGLYGGFHREPYDDDSLEQVWVARKPAPSARRLRSTRPAGGQAEQLVDHVRGGDRRDLSVVVGGRHLDDVGADDPKARERAERGEQLAAGQPTGLGRAGARRVRRVHHVDVDRHVDRQVAHPLAHLVGDRVDRPPQVVERADDREPEPGVVDQVLRA